MKPVTLLTVIATVCFLTQSCKERTASETSFIQLNDVGALMKRIYSNPVKICLKGAFRNTDRVLIQKAYTAWVSPLQLVDPRISSSVRFICDDFQAINIEFFDGHGRSSHMPQPELPASMKIFREKTPNKKRDLAGLILHEFGHAFGLNDLYIEKNSKIQPGQDSDAIMYRINNRTLGKDDELGILSLFAVRYGRDFVLPMHTNNNYEKIIALLLVKSMISSVSICAELGYSRLAEALEQVPRDFLSELYASIQSSYGQKERYFFQIGAGPYASVRRSYASSPYLLEMDIREESEKYIGLTEVWNDRFGKDIKYCQFPSFLDIATSLAKFTPTQKQHEPRTEFHQESSCPSVGLKILNMYQEKRHLLDILAFSKKAEIQCDDRKEVINMNQREFREAFIQGIQTPKSQFFSEYASPAELAGRLHSQAAVSYLSGEWIQGEEVIALNRTDMVWTAQRSQRENKYKVQIFHISSLRLVSLYLRNQDEICSGRFSLLPNTQPTLELRCLPTNTYRTSDLEQVTFFLKDKAQITPYLKELGATKDHFTKPLTGN